MTSTLPPDPYAALGVPKDATSATIKSTYRKLVLKCHPDKVTDPTLKQQKQEEFHKIQQAYELIGDEDKRQAHDAEVRLEQLRREKASRGGVDVKTARYETRTAAPAGATYTSTGVPRYEERKPASRSYDEDRFYEERPRRYDTYEAYPKHSSSSRTTREKESARPSKSATDRTRSDYKKSRDKEERRNRTDKFSTYPGEDSSSADEKMRYEKEFRRRSDDARKAEAEEAERKAYAEARLAAEARRKAETRRSYDEPKELPRRQRSHERERERERDLDHRQRKMEDSVGDAVRYMFSSRSKADHERPSPSRTTSSREIPRETYEGRSHSRRDRPETVRRSSARPKDRTETSGRDRYHIVDWDDDGRSPPSFKHSSSSPADISVPGPRTTPQRSYTESSHRRTETSPTPMLRRHDTAPLSHSSSRRKEEFVSRPSTLRTSESATAHLSPPADHAYPTVPPASTTRKVYYTAGSGGVTLLPEEVNVANGNGRRTILREPDRHARSPSPLRHGISRPPMGENRPRESSSSYTTAAPPRAPMNRSATFNVAEERGRPRLFNEVTPEYTTRRPETYRKNSYSPDKVSYSKKFGPDDIAWARGNRDYSKEQDYPRPGVTRHATVGVF